MDVRAAINKELALSRTIVTGGQDVTPRFRVYAPDGVHSCMVPLPEALDARKKRLETVRSFLIYKAASGFIMSTETIEPNAILTIAVTREETAVALQPIKRNPAKFGPVQWLPPEIVDPAVLNLLPPKSLEITIDQLAFMKRAFGEGAIGGIHWLGPRS